MRVYCESSFSLFSLLLHFLFFFFLFLYIFFLFFFFVVILQSFFSRSKHGRTLADTRSFQSPPAFLFEKKKMQRSSRMAGRSWNSHVHALAIYRVYCVYSYEVKVVQEPRWESYEFNLIFVKSQLLKVSCVSKNFWIWQISYFLAGQLRYAASLFDLVVRYILVIFHECVTVQYRGTMTKGRDRKREKGRENSCVRVCDRVCTCELNKNNVIIKFSSVRIYRIFHSFPIRFTLTPRRVARFSHRLRKANRKEEQ